MFWESFGSAEHGAAFGAGSNIAAQRDVTVATYATSNIGHPIIRALVVSPAEMARYGFR
jgi:hypothetical protein